MAFFEVGEEENSVFLGPVRQEGISCAGGRGGLESWGEAPSEVAKLVYKQ